MNLTNIKAHAAIGVGVGILLTAWTALRSGSGAEPGIRHLLLPVLLGGLVFIGLRIWVRSHRRLAAERPGLLRAYWFMAMGFWLTMAIRGAWRYSGAASMLSEAFVYEFATELVAAFPVAALGGAVWVYLFVRGMGNRH